MAGGSNTLAASVPMVMRRIILLTDGHTDHGRAKTAVNLLRYRPEEVVGILDPTHPGQTAQTLFGLGGSIPVADSFGKLPEADTTLVGIAPSGGQLSLSLRRQILDAIRLRHTIVSGLHQFLSEDPEIREMAAAFGAVLQDVRRSQEREVAHRQGLQEACLRIHTVGHDCNVGKMLVSVELTRALRRRRCDAKFVATGQTGIMIEGDGCAVDAVISDFVNGAAERLVLARQQHRILVVEGQGCLSHPRYSAVTLGLLHGCLPDGLILCYEMGRTHVAGMPQIPLLTLREYQRIYESMACLAHPCRVLGIAMNSRLQSTQAAAEERRRLRGELGLPVCDVIRDGTDELVEAVFSRAREVGKTSSIEPILRAG